MESVERLADWFYYTGVMSSTIIVVIIVIATISTILDILE